MKLGVHVLYEHSKDKRPHGCSYIRLLLPLSYEPNPGKFNVTQSTNYLPADVVVVERAWKADRVSLATMEKLVSQVRRDGARLVYSIDDNLLDLRGNSMGSVNLSDTRLMAIRFLIRESDGVLVSTSRLDERVRNLNPKVVIVPNALDDRLWKSKSALNSTGDFRKIIGYMGTFTHDADLMMVLQAVREILRRHRNVEFHLIGGFTDPSLLRSLEGLPVRVLDATPYAEYPAFVGWLGDNVNWDVAIGPLEDNRFTRCKSDIKFLDYSALGIAGVYSRVPAYENTVRHLENGYLTNNDPDSWAEALEFILQHDEMRYMIARNAQKQVFSSRTLKHRATDWSDAILSLVS